MTNRFCFGSRILFSVVFAFVSALAVCQDAITTDTVSTVPNQQVRVDVPSYVAVKAEPLETLEASVATVVRDPTICCGKGSALYAKLSVADAGSLARVGERLRGKHSGPTGLVVIEDQYWPKASAQGNELIVSLMEKRPLLMAWNGHIYVLYGVVFDLNKHSSGLEDRVIRSFLLLDTRYSDGRRFVKFERQKDDWEKVGGFLSLKISSVN